MLNVNNNKILILCVILQTITTSHIGSKTITVFHNYNFHFPELYFVFPVFECQSLSFRNRCPSIRLNNGRLRTRSSGRVVRVSCNWPFKLVRGNETMTCVGREWNYEYPICASKFNIIFIVALQSFIII